MTSLQKRVKNDRCRKMELEQEQRHGQELTATQQQTAVEDGRQELHPLWTSQGIGLVQHTQER